MQVPTTVDFPTPLPVRKEGRVTYVDVDGHELKVANLDKLFWVPEGHTKADLVSYWFNIADYALPYVRNRPLTLKRMPNGADGDFFYAKQAPGHTPGWMATAPVVSRDGKTVEYLLGQDRAALVWLANLGCIELHPWHARVDDINHPDYAFFDLDPMGAATFGMVRHVALLVRAALDRLGLRSYPRTSGATGMQVFVPIDRVHTAAQVREWVGQVCRVIHRFDPVNTTMEWVVDRRGDEVFLDHNMNTEGKNIAVTYSLRPERHAPVATPLTWDEVATDVVPQDFTIATIWDRLAEVGEIFAPALEGGQDLRAAMAALGMDPDDPLGEPPHKIGPARTSAAPRPVPKAPSKPPDEPVEERLAKYESMRDFSKTAEPPPAPPSQEPNQGPRFVLQHHLARRLHHDLRLERHGTAPSWALPKGLPDVKGVRHLAVQTEDHPVDYMSFEGEIPAGEYGGGPVRIWDSGTYDLLEWTDDKVTFRLHGGRHTGEYHLFRTGGRGDRTGDDPKQWMVVRADDDPADLVPDPPHLEPMLATDGSEPFDDPAWTFEIKWDGVRAVAVTRRPGLGGDGITTLTSRAGNDITGGYPELAPLWERVLARNAVLDCEIVALTADGRSSFQRLQQRMHSRGETANRLRERIPVTLMVFDLLAVDGEALVDLPLAQRLARLDEVLVPGGPFVRSQGVVEHGCAMYAAAEQRQLEGLIAKRLASPYRSGKRTRDWRKIKVRRHGQVVIGGWITEKSERESRIGALLVGVYREGRLVPMGKVGTGFNDAEHEKLCALLTQHARDTSPFAEKVAERKPRWVEPQLVCRVEYTETTEDGKLRHPSYKGLVDTDPTEVLLDDLP